MWVVCAYVCVCECVYGLCKQVYMYVGVCVYADVCMYAGVHVCGLCMCVCMWVV